jgi:FlaA1/EpsC-like NDP-sugar epimerase
MGEPVKIFDLAKRMIELSGLTVRDAVTKKGDIEIEFIGLRPGEKLFEELLIDQNASSTEHPLIMKATEKFIKWGVLETKILELLQAAEHEDREDIKLKLAELVENYCTKDSLHLKKLRTS